MASIILFDNVRSAKMTSTKMILSALSTLFVFSALLVASHNSSATVINYTENTNSATQIALGYPVPVPMQSLTAIDGFRSYQSLHARHQDLMLTHENMQGVIVGKTRHGRDIWAYVFGDDDDLTNDGLPEPVMLINGGIHAREWQSPEVTTEIIEQLVEGSPDAGMVHYLMDNVKIIIVPVLNIDGFLQTQRYHSEVTPTSNTDLTGADLTDPFYDPIDFAIPRDGRMRRKNMPDVDEDLSTNADRLKGVDLNRNSSVFWGVQAGNSDPQSLIYGGLSPSSEPEIQALLTAADLGPANQLRFFVDVHSFSRVLFMPMTSNSRQNFSSQNIASKFARMSASLGSPYQPIPGNPGSDIPVTASYFAFTYQIPTWTLEIEPNQNGASLYGGNGVSHDGFILPESEIARVRDELAPQNIMGFYHQAGPAHIEAVQITDTLTGLVVYEAAWENMPQSNVRQLKVNTSTPLVANGNYSLWIGFNKPMKVRAANGSVPNLFMGLSASASKVNIIGAGDSSTTINHSLSNGENLGATDLTAGWLGAGGGAPHGYQRYPQDSLRIDIQIPDTLTIGNTTGTTELALQVSIQDLTQLNLDGNPATAVGWNSGGWARLEDGNGVVSVVGGPDSTIKLNFDNTGQATSTEPPPPPPPPPPSSSGGGGSTGFSGLMFLLILFTLIWNRKIQISKSHLKD